MERDLYFAAVLTKRCFAVLILLLGTVPGFCREAVVTDSPSQLVIEVTVPEYHLIQGLGGQRVLAGGFGNSDQTGAPDLPWYRFQIASGPGAPTVRIEPLAWVDLATPGGVAGMPQWLTPQKPVAAKNAALFASAGNLQTTVSQTLRFRGLTLRNVAVSMGTYNGASSVHLLQRFRVHVSFSGAGARPNAGVQAWLQRAGAKNPVGGAYLTAFPTGAALAKSARATFTLGSALLKIRVGDQQVDGLAEDGVYALTYETAQAAVGQPLVGVRIADLRMYAGPNDTLPTDMDSTALPPTLAEIPIEVDDNNRNGTFDAGDRIVFFAHGTSVWKPVPGASGAVQWSFGNDPYSFDNYYYLDWSGSGSGTALRLAQDTIPTAGTVVTSTPHYLRAEKDLGTGSCNPGSTLDDETGFDWYWYWRGNCSGSTPILTLTSGQLESSTVDSLEDYAGDSVRIGMFSFVNSSSTYQVWNHGSMDSSDYSSSSLPGAWFVEPPLSGNRIGIDSVVWSGSDNSFEGYTVRYSRNLVWTNQSRYVFPVATGRLISYQIQGGAGVQCLRIEQGVATKGLSVQASGNNGVFTDSAGAGEDVLYYLYQTPTPVAAADIGVDAQATNSGVIQNLWTGDGVDPQYLIVAPQALLTQALALAAYRADSKRTTPYVTAVVRTEDIYREWSGGRLSPEGIRDLLAWALWHWSPSGSGGRLQYVVLFGDGHYDYRNIRNATLKNPLPNFIPPFNRADPETDLLLTNPVCTDDYYGTLDHNADWETGLLDVAVGRISVQTTDQAQNYLDKLSAYEDPKSSGDWRGRITLAADDESQLGIPDQINGSQGHTNYSEALASTIAGAEPGLQQEKVYELDYPFNAANLKPEATQDLINWINQGDLLVTFFGHGAYNQWTDEVLLKTDDALSRMHNNGMPFMVAEFSCTVGRFDKILDDGMNEQFVRQKDDGAIAGIGATRESFPDNNKALALAWASRVFSNDSDSTITTIGMALEQAKNTLGNPDYEDNKQKYTLLGDPALLLHRNPLGISLSNVPDTLQALGCGAFTGAIQGGSGNGFVYARIDGSDIIDSFPMYPGTRQFAIKHGPALFERTVPYQNHAFSMSYLLPKQVPFGDSAAKLQLFAWDAQNPLEASRAVTGLRVLGTATGGTCVVKNDGAGPKIAITGCNTQESGNVDFPAQVKISLPYCLQIEVSDSGGVMSGDGPDEGTTVALSGAFDPYHPQPGVDDLYQKTYQVTLLQNEMSPGTHVLSVTARDGFGNLSLRQVSLEVSADSVLSFVKVFNAPNPMKRSGTVFYFSTTLPQDQGQALTSANTDRINFDLRIFDQNGHLVREFQDAPAGGVSWDGTDAWGQRLANGVYFYSVTATWPTTQGAPGQGQQTSLRNILVISR